MLCLSKSNQTGVTPLHFATSQVNETLSWLSFEGSCAQWNVIDPVLAAYPGGHSAVRLVPASSPSPKITGSALGSIDSGSVGLAVDDVAQPHVSITTCKMPGASCAKLLHLTVTFPGASPQSKLTSLFTSISLTSTM
jgi:hypothetical protein